MKHYTPQLLTTLKIYSYLKSPRQTVQKIDEDIEEKKKVESPSKFEKEEKNDSSSTEKIDQKRDTLTFPQKYSLLNQKGSRGSLLAKKQDTRKPAKITLFYPNFQNVQSPSSSQSVRFSLSSNLSRRAISEKLTPQFFVEIGNNSQLIKNILRKRIWLTETISSSQACIRWKPTSNGINFEKLGKSNELGRQIINHFEFHSEMTNKGKLFLNLLQFSKEKSIELEQLMPKTHLIRLNSYNFFSDFEIFEKSYFRLKQKVYLFKPPDLNQGQGIQLFNDLNSLKKLIKSYISQKNQKQMTEQNDMNRYHSQAKLNNETLQSFDEIVIQKYIENSFLIDGRKFDFRVWALVDHNHTLFWYKQCQEGYLRLSSERYSLDTPAALNNNFIHLTNNAVQKYHQNYGKKEEGNQIGFSDFQQYLTSKCKLPSLLQQTILPFVSWQWIKSQTRKRESFVSKSLGLIFFWTQTKSCIQLKGDKQSIKTSYTQNDKYSTFHLIIKDDAFRLTIDKLFPQVTFAFDSKNYLNEILDEFSLPGYNDSENLWELLSYSN